MLAAKAYRDIDKTSIGSIEELAGYGIHAVIDGRDVYAGNLRLMEKINVKVKPAEEIGTVVYIARTDEYIGLHTAERHVEIRFKRCNSRVERAGCAARC